MSDHLTALETTGDLYRVIWDDNGRGRSATVRAQSERDAWQHVQRHYGAFWSQIEDVRKVGA